MRVPPAQPQVRDWRATARAGLAGALENIAAMLRAARSPKQIRLRATQRQPFFEHVADRVVQSLDIIAIKRGRRPARVDSSQPHALVGVAIAQACQHMLVE